MLGEGGEGVFRDVLILRCAIGNQVASCIFLFALLGTVRVGGINMGIFNIEIFHPKGMHENI